MAKPLWRRPVVVVPAAVVVIGGAVFFGLRAGKSNAGAAQRGTNQQLYTVQPTTLRQTVSASGTIAPSDTEDLSFSSSGTVTAVNVKAGQQVTKGQLLASINSAALQSDLQQAQASLASAQAQLSDDENNSASSAQISADQANVTAAQANAVSAYEALLGTNLTSPIAGTVSTVNLAVGQVLGSSGGSGTGLTGTGTGSGRSTSTGTSGNAASSNGANTSNASSSSSSSPQIEVVSNSFVVNLSVDTRTVSSIKVGQTATVTPTSSSDTSRAGGGGALAFFGAGGFAGGGGGFGGGANNASSQSNASTATGAAATGKVTTVGTVASSSSGVATFPVVITIDGTPASFHAGASASAAIVTGALPNVLAVPVNAVTQSNGQSYVTLSVNGRQSKEVVETGTTVDGQVEITGGLQAGDQVVVTVPTFRRTTGSGNGKGGGGGFGGGGGRFFGPGGGAGGAGTP